MPTCSSPSKHTPKTLTTSPVLPVPDPVQPSKEFPTVGPGPRQRWVRRMQDSLNVEGECNTLCATLTAVDVQLPIAIGATPVVNQRQHHLFDVPARHGCYHGTRPKTPVGTGKTRLRNIQATERPTIRSHCTAQTKRSRKHSTWATTDTGSCC